MTRHDNTTAVIVGDDGADTEPIDVQPTAEPERPAYRSEPAADDTPVERSPRTGENTIMGMPAREAGVGALAVAALAVAGLYQAAGVFGLALAGAGTVTAAGTALAWRHGLSERIRARLQGAHANRRPHASTPTGHTLTASRPSGTGRSAGAALGMAGLTRGLGIRAGRRGRRSPGNDTGTGSAREQLRSGLGRALRARRTRRVDSAASNGHGTTSLGGAFRGAKVRRTLSALRVRAAAGLDRTRLTAAKRSTRTDGWDTKAAALLASLLGWLRAKALPSPTAHAAAVPDTDVPAPDATKAGTANPEPAVKPDTAVKPDSTRSAPTMTTPAHRSAISGNPLVVVSAEMIGAAAAYATEDMVVVASHMDQVGTLPTNIAMAIRAWTDKFGSEYPIHPAFIEALRQWHDAFNQLVTMGESLGPMFRQLHRDDLARHDAPRPGEEKWNVRR